VRRVVGDSRHTVVEGNMVLVEARMTGVDEPLWMVGMPEAPLPNDTVVGPGSGGQFKVQHRVWTPGHEEYKCVVYVQPWDLRL
jgi:hypothetical protein